MKRLTGAIAAATVLVASAGAGIGAWRLTRDAGPALPEVSAYSRGEAVRVGPFFYCNVVDLNDCRRDGDQGELAVDDRNPVQLSVPAAIGRAPWRLLKVYEDERNTTSSVFRPDTHLAVTVPTVDPQRGRVVGLAVQLLTLVQDPQGNVFDLPHAEWSVRLGWDQPGPAPAP